MSSITENDWEKMINGITNDQKGGSKNYFKMDAKFEGEELIRLLPPLFKKGEEKPYFRINVHYLNGKGYTCINQTLKDSSGNMHTAESCPICAMKDKLYKKGVKDSEEWKIAGQIKARNNFFYRGVRLNSEDITNVEFIWLPSTISDELMEKLMSKKYGFILSPGADGRNITLKKKGQGIASKYSYDLEDPSAITKDEEKLKKIAENMRNKDYSELVSFQSKEELQNALNEFLGNENEVDDVFIPKQTVSSPTQSPKQQPKIKEEPIVESESSSTDDLLDDLFG